MKKLLQKGLNKLKDFDTFAETIQFTFRGDTHFATSVGGCMSLLCILIFSVLCIMKTHSLILKEDQELSMIESDQNYQSFDLYELGFMFAIEQFDPRVGSLEVDNLQWILDPESETGSNWNYVDVTMVDCKTLICKLQEQQR